jgi:hypothetical protein
VTTSAPAPTASSATTDDAALSDALRAVLVPLVDLALARGLSYQVMEEMLRRSFVESARKTLTGALPHRMVSRVSIATGLNRREVGRLMDEQDVAAPRRSPATEVFAKWMSNPRLRHRDGRPRTLARQGEGRSFEALAQSVTRDVHPRSLLEELMRLGLVAHDAEADTVSLVREAFVPGGDAPRQLAFLADNVGDHLRSAVDNVLGNGTQHLEQAVFADELSAESVQALIPVLRTQWHALAQALVPTLTQMIEADQAAGRAQDQRVRVGLFSYSAPMPPAPVVVDTDPEPLPAPRSRKRSASSPAVPPSTPPSVKRATARKK